MSDYRSGSMTFEPEPGTAPEPRKRFWTKKKIVGATIAGVVLVPSAAWAAVAIFGFGNFNAAAEANAGTLNIVANTTKLPGKLLPGGKNIGLTMRVANPTDAPVNVVGLIVNTTDGFTVTATDPTTGTSSADTDNSKCKLTLVTSTPVDTIPAHDSVGAKTGVRFAPNPASPQTIASGSNEEINFPNIFKQDPSSNFLCGVSGAFGVKGQIGS